MSWKSRRRWSLAALLVGMPLYVVLAVTLIGMFERPPVVVELVIYVGLGLVWVLPLRALFRGVAREPPIDPSGREK